MPGFDETQALDEEGKAAVGFLQVDEDEEGIDAGFDFESNRHWVPFRTQQSLGQWIF
ncbi:hypothetical protein SLEP1_g31217 [Rubroshorea leprosula]|uniref:Uncharacterized protein n=1 Tax=Rubroshorea leprosula TaxID=152421 RepID=A0AAV5K2Q8_9ROSI|nr:hypothetical protein SLEP1_g31217 [Rubroshorea leprosula]